jgi:dienelactone hydrolase
LPDTLSRVVKIYFFFLCRVRHFAHRAFWAAAIPFLSELVASVPVIKRARRYLRIPTILELGVVLSSQGRLSFPVDAVTPSMSSAPVLIEGRRMNNILKFTAILTMFLQCFSAGAQQEAKAQANRTPWHVPIHGGVEQEQVSFLSRGTQLSGTLYYPSGQHPGPAVVVLHGASSPSKDLPLYEHLKQILPPLGVAVFVYDRRSGQGQRDFNVLAEDGTAARSALTRNPHVDGARIGFWGISQGGWLALAAAAIDPKAAFVISVSAPMTAPDVQMNFAVENILRIHGYGPEEIVTALDARRAVDDYLRGRLDRNSAERALNAARQRPWFPLIYMDDTVGNPETSSWVKQMRFDPMPKLDNVSAPVLMLYGQDDPWVPVRLSMDRLDAIAKQHANISVAVVSRADHTMMLGVDAKDQVDPKFFPKEAPDAPEYFALLAAWLAQHGFAQ